uniref:RING-type domain-containing protein n=1 Tax=Globodera rostochiensis TaxID=31243 RepID=A0A914HYX0_GLORO
MFCKKQRLLEAIYDKVPEDNPNLNGHFSMDEYKYLKTRQNAILHNDPALSQVLQSLINAETSAKLEIKFDYFDDLLVKKLKQRLAFALIFMANRNRIQLDHNLTKIDQNDFLQKLAKFLHQSKQCDKKKFGQNCAIYCSNGNNQNYSKGKRFLQFVAKSLEIDWNVTAPSNRQHDIEAFEKIPPILVDKQRANEEELECAICLNLINLDTKIRPLPNCQHIFHNSCIVTWIRGGRNSCPICRQKIWDMSSPLQQNDMEHQQNIASSSGLGNNSATQNDAMVEADQIVEEQQQFDNNQSEIVEQLHWLVNTKNLIFKMSGMWRFLSLNIMLVKLLHAPISAFDVDIAVPEDKKAEQFEIAGIGVLGTLSEAALGAFLSTWLPELTTNKCDQRKKMESCGKFVWGTCVEENSGMVTNDDPCCMDGFEWQCCAKEIKLLNVHCLRAGFFKFNYCNCGSCFLSSTPWTIWNCACCTIEGPKCATKCVSRPTSDTECPWECCLRGDVTDRSLTCGCCDKELALLWIKFHKEPKEMLLSEDKCKKIVEKHCHCRWAMCHERAGWGASLCCPDGYDLVCCTSNSIKINVDAKKKSDEILIANFGAASQTAMAREMYKNDVCLKTVKTYCPCGLRHRVLPRASEESPITIAITTTE